mmetsp:Transcript_38241/g.85375  ORF Transcript_38241/g.85375 Transcript_38241/m.85375 type:complete len:287 (+) Transcript_38241:267-1127(+)
MLDSRGHVKIIDFGLAHPMSSDQEPLSPTGSLMYMAPELLKEKVGGRFTDWWALGVVAHELLTGRSPWSTLRDKKQIRAEIRGLRVVPPHTLSPPAAHLIASLLQRNPNVRVGTTEDAEVLRCPFFTPIDWLSLARGEIESGITLPRAGPLVSGDPSGPIRSFLTDHDGAAALEAYRRIAPNTSPGAGPAAAERLRGASMCRAEEAPDQQAAAQAGALVSHWTMDLPLVEAHPRVRADWSSDASSHGNVATSSHQPQALSRTDHGMGWASSGPGGPFGPLHLHPDT